MIGLISLIGPLIPVIYFIDPVILPLGMTSRNTHPSGLGLEVIDRDIDSPEHKAFAQVVVLVRGMNVMAGAAGPSLLAINVQIVEIDVPVPEIGHCI